MFVMQIKWAILLLYASLLVDHQKANAVEDTEEESACCVSYEYDSIYACTGDDGDRAKGVTTMLTVNDQQCEGLLDTG